MRTIIRGAIQIARVLVRFVATDDAARNSADYTMVTCVVTCHTADHGAFDAPFSRRWRDQTREHECECRYIYRKLHDWGPLNLGSAT
jgi:hypothetical protein